jgi:hypothetical protein
MNSYLRQATASQTRLIGPFVDDTDFKTAETGLTIANTDIKLSINGGSSANKNSGGGTHIVNGEYAITLDATDTATVGELTISVSVSGALIVKKTFWVLEEAIYDALFAASATGLLPANVTQISGDSGAADNLELAYDGTGYDVGGIDVSELNQIVDDLLNGGRLDLLVDAIKAKTDNLAFTTAGKVDARVDYVGANAVTSPDDFKATSVTVSDKTGFSLAADQSGVTIGTVNAMAGTITTLDALDAAQDSQHSTTQSAIGALNNIAATDIVSAGPITTLSGAVVNVDTVDTCTTNTDMRGTDGANTITPPTVSAIRTEIDGNSTQLAAILEDTGTTLPAQITLAQNDLDILTGTDGATLSTASTTAIGAGFLSTALTKGTAGTIERAFWQILKTQAVTDGTAVADASNTTTTFHTNLTAVDGVYDHMIILFTSNGLEGEARPIDTYVQTNGVITLQEPLTTAPAGDEEFIILPQHAHPISEIQNGLATSTALQTAQDDLDILTGTDGVTLATLQPNYTPLDGAGVRTAIGMASANMDTQLGNIQAGVDGITVSSSPTLLQSATISTLASQTSFTLSAGSTDDDAYQNAIAIIVDQSTSTQKTVVNISDYIGSTRTVTLNESPKFTIATGDTVYVVATSKTTLTDDVVNSLTGTLVRFNGPAWTGNGWDRPFIKGDSYLGGNKVSITVENWSGDQLISAASAIKLSGTRTVSGTTTTFSWSVTPSDVTVSGTTTTIPLELTASDTDIDVGEYTADLRATWTSPAEVTSLIQPTFKLSIVAPVSTFD